MATITTLTWHRVAGLDELDEGRVRTVVAGPKSIALTHHDGQYGALDNHCPHQGGPLGEGSIENGLLRCPWHGYDYCPLTGSPPGDYADTAVTYPVEVREDGVYVAVAPEAPHERTVSDLATLRRPDPAAAIVGSAWRSLGPLLSNSSTSGSDTRARPRSPRRRSASSPAAPRHA